MRERRKDESISLIRSKLKEGGVDEAPFLHLLWKIKFIMRKYKHPVEQLEAVEWREVEYVVNAIDALIKHYSREKNKTKG